MSDDNTTAEAIFDLSDTDDQAGPSISLLPRGEYDFMIIKKPELGTAKDSGSKLLKNMQLKIDNGDGKDHYCWTNLTIHPNTIRMVKAFLLSLGFRDRKLSESEIYTNEFAEELVGMTGRAMFDVDPNPGYSPKQIVKWYVNEFSKRRNEPGEADSAPLLGATPDDMPF